MNQAQAVAFVQGHGQQRSPGVEIVGIVVDCRSRRHRAVGHGLFAVARHAYLALDDTEVAKSPIKGSPDRRGTANARGCAETFRLAARWGATIPPFGQRGLKASRPCSGSAISRT